MVAAKPRQKTKDVWLIGSEDLKITDLLSYRLYQTANSMQKSAIMIYRAEFGVSLGEWRTLALLGAYEPLPLNQLARQAGFDKGQMSRVVSGLVDRKLVLREDGPGGGRAISLTLTKKGRNLYERIMRVAAERHRAFLSCLTEEEMLALDSALAKLNDLGRALARPLTSRATAKLPKVS